MRSLSLPAAYSPQKRAAVERRLLQLQESLGSIQKLLLLLHNDPDPDALASGHALRLLLRRLCPHLQLTLGYGGMIGRSENRSLAELITTDLVRIPLPEVDKILKAHDAVALIDTQPSAGNHLLYNSHYPSSRVAVTIDHHPPRRSQLQATYHDVRPEIGASSTLLSEYLAAAQIAPDPEMATALFYGIKSDTRGLSRHGSMLDAWAYTTLHGLLNAELLATIEQARVPESYFKSLSHALAHTNRYRGQTAYLVQDPARRTDRDLRDYRSETDRGAGGEQPPYADVLISLLGEMERPDMAAEVADLLLRLEGVVWVICLGIYEDRIVISVRCEAPEAHAGRLVRAIVGRSGTAGGHDAMAGGRIHLPTATPAERTASLHSLVPLFLEQLGIADAPAEQILGG